MMTKNKKKYQSKILIFLPNQFLCVYFPSLSEMMQIKISVIHRLIYQSHVSLYHTQIICKLQTAIDVSKRNRHWDEIHLSLHKSISHSCRLIYQMISFHVYGNSGSHETWALFYREISTQVFSKLIKSVKTQRCNQIKAKSSSCSL